MQYEEGMYYDPTTGERVLLVDFAKWRKILNGNDDPIPDMPPSDHDYLFPGHNADLADALNKLCGPF